MEPIQKIAIHELVVNRLRRAIHLGDYLPGEQLPSERDIAYQLKVSRETIREAIRVLEGEGYVVSRRGAAGGHAVAALVEPAARTLARLRGDQDSIINLMEFRRANECLAASLAAKRHNDSDLEKITGAVEDLKSAEDISRFRKADARFHLAVARAARNSYTEQVVADTREAIFLLHGNRDYNVILDTTLKGHRDILEAIRSADPDRAAEAMAQHIDVALKEILHVLTDSSG